MTSTAGLEPDRGWLIPGERGPVASLDGLRTVAIAAVTLIHLHYFRGGWLGVPVFFVLSGFLIGTLLLLEQNRSGKIGLGRFYVRRLARLYPALIGSIVLGIVVAELLQAFPAATIRDATIPSLLYVSNWIPFLTNKWLPLFNSTWSLGQEEQFYLIAPLAVLLVKPNQRRIAGYISILIAAVLALARISTSYLWRDGWISTYHNPVFNMDGLTAGLGVALLLQAAKANTSSSQRFVSLARTLSRDWIAVLAFCGCVGLFILISPSTPLMAFATPLVIFGTIITILNLVMRSNGLPSKLLSLRPLTWLGQRSYGIYLYQTAVFLIVDQKFIETPRPWLYLIQVAAVLTTTGLAALSKRFLEDPIRRKVRSLQQASIDAGRDGRS